MKHKVPFSKETEAAMLHCALHGYKETRDDFSELNEEDFFTPGHVSLFIAIKDILSRGQGCDVALVVDYMRSSGHLNQSGGIDFITEIITFECNPSLSKDYVKKLKEQATLRRLQSIAFNTLAAIDRPNADTSTVTSIIEKALNQGSIDGIEEYSFSELQDITNEYLNSPAVCYYQTGFRGVQFSPKDFVVIGARPGVGKTSLMITLMDNMCSPIGKSPHDFYWKDGTNTDPLSAGLITIEMPAVQLNLKEIAVNANISAHRLKRKEDAEVRFAQKAIEELRNYKVRVADASKVSLPLATSLARKWKRLYGLQILFIDYLQLMTAGGKYNSRHEEVAAISGGLKSLAKELDIVVVGLAQVNRKSADEGNRPYIHHLRESGSIEQDADMVLLLHPKPNESDDDGGREEDEESIPYDLYIDKYRNGPKGMVRLRFLKDSTKFIEDEHFYMSQR